MKLSKDGDFVYCNNWSNNVLSVPNNILMRVNFERMRRQIDKNFVITKVSEEEDRVPTKLIS